MSHNRIIIAPENKTSVKNEMKLLYKKMGYVAVRLGHGIYYAVFYITFYKIPIPLIMRILLEDEFLDHINRFVRPNKELSDEELRRKCNLLRDEYEAALKERRERAYKLHDLKK